MNVISRFISESSPDNPGDVVLKNSFYPSGLTEQQVYDYYMSVKDKIIEWIAGRNVAFFIRVGKDLILRRYHKGEKIVLTEKNYEEMINGRVNVVLVEMQNPTKYYVIDIDPGKNKTRNDSIEAVKFLEDNFVIKMYTYHYDILTSSSKGIHFIGRAPRPIEINKVRKFIFDTLSLYTRNSKEYVVNKKGRAENTINFDLSSMVKSGLHICKYSLTKDGLQCNDYKKGLIKIK